MYFFEIIKNNIFYYIKYQIIILKILFVLLTLQA